MANPPNNETMRQIAEAFENAKSQLAILREQVQKAGELANLKLHSAVLEREEDRAFRDFGLAVWAEVKKGTLKLPPTMAPAAKLMAEVQKKRDLHLKEINDILKEGDEAADRMNKKAPAPTKSKPSGKTERR